MNATTDKPTGTLIESTPRFSIYIDYMGHYTIERHSDHKTIYFQGDSARLVGETIGSIRSKYSTAPDIPAATLAQQSEFDWLCANYFDV